MKQNKSIRFDGDVVSLSQKLGIDISKIARKALEMAVAEAAGKCPTCGQKLPQVSANKTDKKVTSKRK